MQYSVVLLNKKGACCALIRCHDVINMRRRDPDRNMSANTKFDMYWDAHIIASGINRTRTIRYLSSEIRLIDLYALLCPEPSQLLHPRYIYFVHACETICWHPACCIYQ